MNGKAVLYLHSCVRRFMATESAAIVVVEVCDRASNAHRLSFSSSIKQVASWPTNPNVLIVLLEEIEISAQLGCQRNDLLFVVVGQWGGICVLNLQCLLLFLQVGRGLHVEHLQLGGLTWLFHLGFHDKNFLIGKVGTLLKCTQGLIVSFSLLLIRLKKEGSTAVFGVPGHEIFLHQLGWKFVLVSHVSIVLPLFITRQVLDWRNFGRRQNFDGSYLL